MAIHKISRRIYFWAFVEIVNEWSRHAGHYLTDLLPVAYNENTLRTTIQYIQQVQECLGQILIENPSRYVVLEETDVDKAT